MDAWVKNNTMAHVKLGEPKILGCQISDKVIVGNDN